MTISTDTNHKGGLGVTTEDNFEDSEDVSNERFPRANLDSAIEVTEIVVNYGYSAKVPQVAGLLGQSTKSGAFRMRMSAAAQFGLLTPGRGEVTLTRIGKEISDPSTSGNARVSAFLNVPLYEKLFKHFESSRLPPAQGLDEVLVRLGVRRSQCDSARRIFLASAEQAGFMLHGRERLILPPSGPPPKHEVIEPDDESTESAAANRRVIHPLIEGLLQLLPTEGRMERTQFERWMNAFRINAELVYLNDATEPSNED